MTGQDPEPGASTVLLAGASGFLGSALADRLARRGRTVRRLVRRAPVTPEEFGWDPTRGEADERAFDGVDAVVGLSGAGVFDRPWTSARKTELYLSRTEPTRTLAEVLARRARELGHRPALVLGSAIGWYGVQPSDEPHVEGDPPGSDFLAELVRDWEAQTEPAVDAGLLVAIARTSIVISSAGGAFRILRRPFSIGMGAVLGAGTQRFPIISLDDWLAAMDWLVDGTAGSSGPYNLTIPTPVTNAEFSRTLARQLNRPLLITAPERVLRQLLGPMADQLFGDQYVIPKRLLEEGFSFRSPDAAAVIAAALD